MRQTIVFVYRGITCKISKNSGERQMYWLVKAFRYDTILNVFIKASRLDSTGKRTRYYSEAAARRAAIKCAEAIIND